ncbi:hypothetical protein P8605_02110 [Streptomyces sp. T-3]|nr:hypothetical protein [Streptomyces sp. T-3]
MSSESDSVAPISAPNTGPDPRGGGGPAPNTGPDPRTSHQLDTPAPDARPDVRDLDPSPGTYPSPGTHGGLQPMSAADTAPDPRFQAPTTPLTGPDPRIEAPTTPVTGLDPRDTQQPGRVHQMPAPDGPTDVRDRNPAPGANPDPGFQPSGIQTMSAGTGPSGPGPSGPGPGGTSATQASGADDNGYGVSNSELGKMADELDLAATILEKADKGLAESDTTARIHNMLTSGRMLQSTTGDWDDEITRLAKECRALADKMRQTHTNYTAQEHRTAQDFQSILASLEGDA